MSAPRKRAWNRLDEIASLLVLGGGFVAMFAGSEQFFLIWILGFVVFVPLISILTDGTIPSTLDDDHITQPSTATEWTRGREQQSADDPDPSSTQDALTTLRERYARGDLTDEQFDRKLTRLLETDTPENAMEWRERTEQKIGIDPETETER
ncbi:SHOCT domain-containing protein [Halocatena salina]|uniref:SHOCT domain-containing protein n=1 Tax=Halocatena salina TaxID=2934340 RepID=A0A8U0A5T4_9EURY|nr:SHOCT domain-containing protein [Halocatena salina]UPM43848.1 SHOCT domain-containing protein [Halocatena salina]